MKTPDEAAIHTIVESVATLADRGNFESLEKLYAREVEVDYTSAFGKEIELRSLQALMTQWASNLPGFDRTYHQISNIKTEVKGNKATARTYKQRYGGLFHVVDGKIELFREYYDPIVFKDAFGLDES